jgi:tetratricopeptide (TPR) repeat protein
MNSEAMVRALATILDVARQDDDTRIRALVRVGTLPAQFKGTGLTWKPDKKKRDGISVFHDGRHSTVTGSVYQGSKVMAAAQAELDELLRATDLWSRMNGSPGQSEKTDRELTKETVELAKKALAATDPDLHYDQWVKVGMALRSLGDVGFKIWDEWSRRGATYKPGETRAKWASFKPEGVGLGSLFYVAEEEGGFTLRTSAEDDFASFRDLPEDDEAPAERYEGGSLAKWRALVVATNLEDRGAALHFLRNLSRVLSEPGAENYSAGTLDARSSTVNEILTKHPADGEILYGAARVRGMMGDFASAATLLTSALEHGYRTPAVLERRALALMNLGRTREAIDDFVTVLNLNTSEFRDVHRAARQLAELEPNALHGLGSLASFQRLDAMSQLSIAYDCVLTKTGLVIDAEYIVRGVLDHTSDPLAKRRAKHYLALCLIAHSKFAAAMDVLAQSRESVARSDSAADVFNYAMAEWGASGRAPRDLFARVLELDRTIAVPDRAINYQQCLAITYHALGLARDAHERLELAYQALALFPRTEFSAWRYLNVQPRELRKDLDALGRAINGASDRPWMFRQESPHS